MGIGAPQDRRGFPAPLLEKICVISKIRGSNTNSIPSTPMPLRGVVPYGAEPIGAQDRHLQFAFSPPKADHLPCLSEEAGLQCSENEEGQKGVNCINTPHQGLFLSTVGTCLFFLRHLLFAELTFFHLHYFSPLVNLLYTTAFRNFKEESL